MHQPALNMSDGVVMGEGDGTVTLMSLGYHCSKVGPSSSSSTHRCLVVHPPHIVMRSQRLLVGGCSCGPQLTNVTSTLVSTPHTHLQLWRQKSHNPASVHVTTRELLHADSGMTLISRGGGSSGDHVDIMGNHEMASEVGVCGCGCVGVVCGPAFHPRL
jgi:hypothetical protein